MTACATIPPPRRLDQPRRSSPPTRRLHELGWTHSVEAWTPDGELAGGLYGVAIGGFFAGESMFHRATDASKVALVGLVEHLRRQGLTLLDVQWVTPHLATLGVVEIPRRRVPRPAGRGARSAGSVLIAVAVPPPGQAEEAGAGVGHHGRPERSDEEVDVGAVDGRAAGPRAAPPDLARPRASRRRGGRRHASAGRPGSGASCARCRRRRRCGRTGRTRPAASSNIGRTPSRSPAHAATPGDPAAAGEPRRGRRGRRRRAPWPPPSRRSGSPRPATRRRAPPPPRRARRVPRHPRRSACREPARDGPKPAAPSRAASWVPLRAAVTVRTTAASARSSAPPIAAGELARRRAPRS